MTLHGVKKSLFASTNRASLPFFLVFSPSLSLSPVYFPRHARISRPSSSRSGSTSFMKYPLLNICNRQGNRDFRARASARRRPSSLAHVRMCVCMCVYARVCTRATSGARGCVRYFTFALRCLVARKLIAVHFSSRDYSFKNFKFQIPLGQDSEFFFSVSPSFSFFFFSSPCLSY